MVAIIEATIFFIPNLHQPRAVFFMKKQKKVTNRGKIYKTCSGSLASARSRSGSDSPPDCHSIPSRRSAKPHYPREHSSSSRKVSATAKAKYERLKKLVEFYEV